MPQLSASPGTPDGRGLTSLARGASLLLTEPQAAEWVVFDLFSFLIHPSRTSGRSAGARGAGGAGEQHMETGETEAQSLKLPADSKTGPGSGRAEESGAL